MTELIPLSFASTIVSNGLLIVSIVLAIVSLIMSVRSKRSTPPPESCPHYNHPTCQTCPQREKESSPDPNPSTFDWVSNRCPCGLWKGDPEDDPYPN